MAGVDTRQLQLQISASAELMIRNLRQADAEVGKFQRDVNGKLMSIDARFEALGKVRTKLAGLGAGDIFGAVTGASLVALAKRGLDYASSLAEVAQQLGVTTRELQVYRFMASQAGVGQEELDKGLQKLTANIGKATLGDKQLIKFFDALGISVATLKRQTTGETFRSIADGLEKIPDRAQRGAIEMALMGRSAQQLDTMLAGGGRAIDELAASAERLGLVLSDEQIQRADDTADKLAAVKTQLEANIAGVVADNAGSIVALATSLGQLTGEVIKFLGANPQLALAIVGGLAGGRVGGLPGAAIGALGGAILGNSVAETRDDASSDLAVRRRRLREAREAYHTARTWRAPTATFRESGATSPSTNLPDARAELQRQVGLMSKAVASARRGSSPGSSGTGTAVPQLFASEHKGRSAEQLAREAEAAARKDRGERRRADNLLSRANADVLGAQAERSLDPNDRLRIGLERIELAKQGRDDDLAEQALDNKYIAANLTALKLANGKVAAIDKELAQRKRAQEVDRGAEERAQAAADDELLLLELTARLTDVAKERWAIERRILAAKQQHEREALEQVIADRSGRYTADDRQLAQDRLDRLSTIHGAQSTALARDQRGPGALYRDGLISDANKTAEAIERIKVDGLQSLDDGLVDTIMRTRSLGAAFEDVSRQIIAALIRIAIQRAVIAPLANMLFPGTSPVSAGLGTGSGSFGFSLGSIVSTPGFATGGSMLIGGRGGTDQNVLSLNGQPIARVSRGETLNIATAGMRASTIGSVAGAGGGGAGGIATLRVLLSGDLDARIDARAAGVAVQVVRAAAPELVDAAVNETVATLGRPRM